MSNKSKARKAIKKAKPKLPTTRQVGDRVERDFNGTKLIGRVTMIGEGGEVAVEFDHGDEITCHLDDLSDPSEDYSIEASTPVHADQPGFNQYAIEWVDAQGEKLVFGKPHNDPPERAIRFRAQADGVKFYGQWRITRTSDGATAWCIDIYANYNGQPYTMSPLVYYDRDPRIPAESEEMTEGGEASTTRYAGMRDLNGDICMAINKFLHFHLSGNVQTIDDLRNRANHPVIAFESFDAIRSCILQLTDLYNKSLRSGGYRTCEIKGDTPESVPVLFTCNLTGQVRRAIEGEVRIPPAPEPPAEMIENSGVIVTPGKVVIAKPGRPKRTGVPDPTGNAKELIDQLKAIQAKPSKDRTPDEVSYAKKLRAALRKVGHHGGTRAA